MKRAQDKIKDYVEPQAFDEVPNLAADPARALTAYRFTDVTSDLLARWLDALADLPRGRGASRALAGVRGVGKSHALTVFGALAAATPELRSAVKDAHVATSARRLLERRHIVVRVERGLRPTLLEEMVVAFTETIGADASQWGQDPVALMSIAASRTPDATLVIIIDTAFNRETRVGRDDGPVLSRLANAARDTNAFVALALDDDIADASGINSVLAASYAIDYLDPEHLYRIADQYLLRKNPQARAALHEIYLTLRTSVPGFNWSEPRFAALYPVHPLVADVAAAVRLYAPRFAFLPFAAAAAVRAVSRPALSLILLDEVFDRAEHDLRQSPELEDAFVAYDDFARRVVAQFPVMQRLQAKLVLKSLFIHSLDGRGATTGELCAGLLLSDEQGASGAVERIEEMLARFFEAAPDALARSVEGGETHYRFQISASAKFDVALAASVESAPQTDDAIDELLRSIPRTRFADWPLAGEHEETQTAADFQITWRGSERPGRFIWQPSAAASVPPPASPFPLDWQILMRAPTRNAAQATDAPADASNLNASLVNNDAATPISFVWQPSELTAEESSVLRRLIALRADAKLLTDFGETARAALSTYGAQAERIWMRLYMDDGLLVADAATRRTFTDEARAVRTLSAALAQIFAPLFGLRYPQHPLFAEKLGDVEVARLIDGLLGNADTADAGVQHLAYVFALPLGLASLRGDLYTLETGDDALAGSWVRAVLALTDAAADGEVVSLDDVRRALRREPYGLLPEAQHLILAALVAQRRIELVTTTGDRISRRTLDSSLKWTEIAGVCRAAAIHHSAEELTAWARLLTGRQEFASISDPDARPQVRAALVEWLEGWRALRLGEKFNALSDEGLTTRAWSMATAVRKSFGAAADTVEAMVAGDVSLEEGLQRVADGFGGSMDTFARLSQQSAGLAEFTEGLQERERVRAYLAFAEPTGLDEVESARRELLALAEDAHSLFADESRARFNLLWREFHTRYTEHYAAAHDRAAGGETERAAVEEFLRGDLWREFELISQLSIVNRRYREETEELLTHARRAPCDLPVRELLELRPVCACSFRLAGTDALARLPLELEQVATLGLASYRRTLTLFSKQLRHALDALVAVEADTETASRARALANALAVGLIPEHLSRANVRLLDRAVKTMTAPPPVRLHPPTELYGGLLTRDELSARLRQWLDELPDHTALLEIINEKETDAAQ
ncbi:MAG TPA: hypothetical protein VNA19_09710 [Pyrinomonadaceae bacterium]|jgi:hypothetical protein|nr:hypothetical protein [Pyrinomonadaceae bacterium]